MAETRMAPLQSRWSHWIRSPGSTSHSAAPLSASTPFTQKNQSTCPPARPPLHAVDRLHEAAAVARGHVELLAEHAHHGLALADLVERDRAELAVPEVTGDSEGSPAAGLLSALAEAAARRRREAGDQQGCDERADTSHGTSTRSVNERTRPSFRATSRCEPAGSAIWTRPSAAVSPVTPPAVTLAPSTGTPSPPSSYTRGRWRRCRRSPRRAHPACAGSPRRARSRTR